MGQKVNPIGFRLGVNRTWDSRWFADGAEYAKLLHEDFRIREYLRENLKQAGISRIIIERPHKKCRVTIYSARPGVVIGKKGADIENLRRAVSKMTDSEVHLNIVEVRKPEIDANLVADNIAQQLERRIAFRRAMKRAVQSAMRMGAEGIRSPVRAVWAVLKSRVPNGTVKAVCRCTRCAPTSITVPRPRTPPMAPTASRSGSSRVRSSSTIRWHRTSVSSRCRKAAVRARAVNVKAPATDWLRAPAETVS
jgi:ribosomal protein S3